MRTALSALGLWVLLAAGCGQTTQDGEGGGAGAGPRAGTSGAAGTPGAIGSGGAAGTPGAIGSGGAMVGSSGVGPTPTPGGGVSADDCSRPGAGARVFEQQAVDDSAPAVRELFTWTTPEQIAELRAGARLLNRTERPGLGPGYAFVTLKELAGVSTVAEEKELAELLLTEPFERARFAWPNPWATRMGFPGESYGGELVRIELREEAFLVVFKARSLSVVDMANREVELSLALANPERIAGLYFVKDHSADAFPICGTFQNGEAGYREFIVANESMIAEWSLATAAVRARLEDDIRLLEAFRERIQSCESPVRDLTSWQRFAFCRYSNTDVWDAYYHALAMPNENYLPEREQLTNMIETLRGDLFEPDPFVVAPER